MRKPTEKPKGPLKLRTYQGVDGTIAYAADGRTWATRDVAGKLAPVDVGEAWVWAEDADAA